MSDRIEVVPGKDNDHIPEMGDIVASLKSGTEYVLHAIRDRPSPDGEGRVLYPVFLVEKDNGRLSEPFVVVGGFDGVVFVERGAPRNPGEKPVRPLKKDPEFARTTMTAPPGRLKSKKKKKTL